MFNSISGTITAKSALSIYLENSGIEWDIMVPSLSLDSFGLVGEKTRVYTWLYHREDQMRLFGFASTAERDIFIDLMKVEGIGPRQAIKILSSISSTDLEKALEAEDLNALEAAPGIGKKTAQKMILALKGKLTRDLDVSRTRRSAPRQAHEDIIEALTSMGYERNAASDAVFDAAGTLGVKATTADAETEKEIFRRALVALSTR